MKIYPTKFRVAVFIFALCVVSMAGICCSGFHAWRNAVRQTKEQVLKDDLVRMRAAIRTYAIKTGGLPQTFGDLATVGVITTVPDPMTDRADWQVTIGEDPALIKGKRGVINVHSASTAISSQGTPYNTW